MMVLILIIICCVIRKWYSSDFMEKGHILPLIFNCSSVSANPKTRTASDGMQTVLVYL